MLDGRKYISNFSMSFVVIVFSIWGWKWDILVNLNYVRVRFII